MNITDFWEKFKQHKSGFTLAEVLITIGIIGVVAALTIPQLQANSRERELATRLKKSYSIISQALTKAIVEFGIPEYWNLSLSEDSDGGDDGSGAVTLQDHLTGYFQVSKDCENKGGCWPDTEILKLNNSSTGINFGSDTSYATFRIVDGTLFAFKVLSKSCDTVVGTGDALENVCAEMYIDVNGERKPNQMGYDVFKFYVVKNGIYPAGMSNDTVTSFDNECLKKTSGYGCTAWVIYQANMDYMHCSDIGWDGKTSCKNIFNYNYSTGI